MPESLFLALKQTLRTTKRSLIPSNIKYLVGTSTIHTSHPVTPSTRTHAIRTHARTYLAYRHSFHTRRVEA
jgi:hypothetical protein